MKKELKKLLEQLEAQLQQENRMYDNAKKILDSEYPATNKRLWKTIADEHLIKACMLYDFIDKIKNILQ